MAGRRFSNISIESAPAQTDPTEPPSVLGANIEQGFRIAAATIFDMSATPRTMALGQPALVPLSALLLIIGRCDRRPST
jgi:hypothetical protein